MNGEVLSVMNIKTAATSDTKKFNNDTKAKGQDFKKTFEEVKSSKSEQKTFKKEKNDTKESKVNLEDSNDNSQKIEKEKVKVESSKETDNLEKVDQQTLKKVKDLLEKLGIEVSDEVLNQLAMKFDFDTILDTLSSMKFINNNELDLSGLLESMKDLTDALESMKNFLMNQTVPELSENEVKMKFDHLLNQLNGKIQSVEVSETSKAAKGNEIGEKAVQRDRL
jgi:hypothetical protein